MTRGPRHRVPFRRRREGRTDYRRRLALLKSGKPRAVVRKTNRSTTVQFVAYDASGDRVVAAATSQELPAHGWEAHTGNVPAAYLAGFLAGTRARAAGVEEAVLDIGLHVPSPGSRVFAALKGVLDAGVAVPHGEAVLPSDDRSRGAHVSEALATQTDKVKEKLEGL